MQPGSELRPGHHPRAFTDGAVVLVAAAAAIGSFAATAVAPLVLVAAAGAVLFGGCRARPFAVALAVGLLCSTLADRSLAGLAVPPVPEVAGRAMLVTDPERFEAAVRTDVRLDGKRYEVWLRGPAAGMVDELQVGDTVVVEGRVRPPGRDDVTWFRPRHVVGRLTGVTVSDPRPARAPWSWANAVRDVLRRGLTVLDEERRVLALGFLVGDDRGLDPALEDDLRTAGLSHLAAVSGQNVAFVLVLVRPLLACLGRWGRLVGIAVVLALFGFITRWEPSVLRATAMAAVAIAGVFGGRPASGLRYLALAVTGLLIIDPLLVWSVGFRLSVAASAGILVISPRIVDRLVGPRLVREALAVTLGAQLAVAPLLVTTFGPVPLASVPANLLAGPAAGLAMMWGLPAGLVAGVSGPPLATVLHLPTGLAVGWVASVARWAVSLPLPRLGVRGLWAVVGAVCIAAALAGLARLGRRRRSATGLDR